MRVPRAEAEAAQVYAVRDWRDLTPGVYRYFYIGAENADVTVEYSDIAVFGLAPDDNFRYTAIFTRNFGPARESLKSLADAGVYRYPRNHGSLPGYLGKNFMVPIEKVK